MRSAGRAAAGTFEAGQPMERTQRQPRLRGIEPPEQPEKNDRQHRKDGRIAPRGSEVAVGCSLPLPLGAGLGVRA